MKINLFLNDYFILYNKYFEKPKTEFKLDLIEKIPIENNLIILRGEPTLYSKLDDVLKYLHKKNYIITTDGEKVESLFRYRGRIPYISFHYDGFLNDQLRGYRSYLTYNILKALNYYAGKSTLRLIYTINPYNKEWLDVDISILRHLYNKYPNMKKPYILIHQQCPYFAQRNFSWTSIDIKIIDKFNKAGILTDKTLRYLAAYFDGANYSCVSPKNEVVITPDGKVRLCLSFRFDEILGDLNKQSFEEIVESSKEIRESAVSCSNKQNCWLALHVKENVNNV